jgi:hypothetical protein
MPGTKRQTSKPVTGPEVTQQASSKDKNNLRKDSSLAWGTPLAKFTPMKGKKSNANNGNKEIQRAIDKARKRWEFNLVKTGNIAANYNSGNSVRAPGKATGPRRARNMNDSAVPETNPSDTVTVHELTNQRVHNKPVIFDEKIAAFDVYGSPVYEVTSYAIQPALLAGEDDVVMFPIISNIARNFERYRFERLDLVFVPFVSGFDGDGARGQVNLSADYNVMAGEPASILAAERTDPHVTAMAKDRMRLRLDPAKLCPVPKYTRTGDYPLGGDPKSYDAGRFYIATQGQNDTQKIGTIYVEYRLALYSIVDINGAAPPAPSAPVRIGTWDSYRQPTPLPVGSAWAWVDSVWLSSLVSTHSAVGSEIFVANDGDTIEITASVQAVYLVTMTASIDCTDATNNRNSALFGACFVHNSDVLPDAYSCEYGAWQQAGTVGALNQVMGPKRVTVQAVWHGLLGPGFYIRPALRGLGYDPVGMAITAKDPTTPVAFAPGPFNMDAYVNLDVVRLSL